MKPRNYPHHAWRPSRTLIVALCLTLAAALSARAQSPDQSLLVPPVNDSFASPVVLSGLSGNSAPLSNIEATGEAGEPNHAGVSAPLNSLWYRWTSPGVNVSMTFQATAIGPSYDATIAVYTGSSLGGLTLVTANNNAGNFYEYARATFRAVPGTTYYIAVDGAGTHVNSNVTLSWFINRAENGKQFDFDGDLKSDFAVYRQSNGTWYIRRSSDGGLIAQAFGLSSDLLVPGDYDGDARTDICVWRPSTGTFYALRSSNGTLLSMPWGTSGDTPVQGDFDGDDQADFAVWRRSSATFYVRRSSDGGLTTQTWGDSANDVIAPGDYDGDGKTDFGVFRISGPNAGNFYIWKSTDGSLLARQWGFGSDIVTPGDYNRDGMTDFAVYRQSNRTLYTQSLGFINFITAWGAVGDFLTPGDYDGDGYSDPAVWRPSTGTFYVQRVDESLLTQPWGLASDYPVANTNVH